MAKQVIKKDAPPPLGFLPKATLAAACVVLLLNVSLWTQNRSNQAALTDRLTRIETQMGQLSTKMDNVARGGGQKGPDANKVYTVKTDGAPFEGPSAAPITLVEFSDFQ